MTTAVAPNPSARTSDRVQFYHDQGFLVVRAVFDADDIASMAAEADRLLASGLVFRDNMRCRWRDHVDTGEQVFDLFEPVLDVAPALARHIQNPVILALLEEIFGEPARHMREKLIYKAPRAMGVKLHQDWHSWERQPKSFTTVAIAIDPFDEETGLVEVYPGLQHEWLGPPDSWYFMDEKQVEGFEPVPLQLDPGDVAVFGPLIPHRSAFNRSFTRWRRGLFVGYNARSDGGDRREEAYRNYLEYRWAHRHEKNTPNLTFR